jgi:glutathione peroxidase
MLIHDFSARLATGEERRFADYRGKVLLIVNVASKCGFTPQYRGLPSTNSFTRAALKSLLSHVISSAIRSRGQTPRSLTSATMRMV